MVTLDKAKEIIRKAAKVDSDIAQINEVVKKNNPQVNLLLGRIASQCSGVGDFSFRIGTISPNLFRMVDMVGMEEMLNLQTESHG